ncbi:MAG: hypothetical protein HY426_02330 [Candidatus Levybacteria bacterium]|nr:hypothetical protein [Candidatus Levybacteria bacterium]
MAVSLELGHAPTPPEAQQAPAATPEITFEYGVQVLVNPKRDNAGIPIFVFPAEEPVSAGMLKLAEIVGPMRWNVLVVLTKSDMTPEERAAFVRALRATPVLDDGPVSGWSRDDWRVSRHYTDNAFAFAFTKTGHGNGGMRNRQAGFVQSLGCFIDRFPEGEEEMKGLFEAIYELGTSADWEKNPNLARELATAYWDVGEKVLESWTAQPPQALAAAA